MPQISKRFFASVVKFHPMPRKTKSALFLNSSELAKLKALAKRLDVSASHLIREGIRMVLEKYSTK
jgi:hypothetical protein